MHFSRQIQAGGDPRGCLVGNAAMPEEVIDHVGELLLSWRRIRRMGLRLYLYMSERAECVAVRKDGIASDDLCSVIQVVEA
jgi:hypothetical protein